MHAEHNALLNAQDKDVAGCTMYVTLHPCNQCTKLILDSGISEVIYHEDRDTPDFKASKLMFGLTSPRIKYRYRYHHHHHHHHHCLSSIMIVE